MISLQRKLGRMEPNATSNWSASRGDLGPSWSSLPLWEKIYKPHWEGWIQRHDNMKFKDAKGWNIRLVTPHKDADRPLWERSMVSMIDCASPKCNERWIVYVFIGLEQRVQGESKISRTSRWRQIDGEWHVRKTLGDQRSRKSKICQLLWVFFQSALSTSHPLYISPFAWPNSMLKARTYIRPTLAACRHNRCNWTRY